MKSRIPRNVWVLGFVSLLTDVSSEMIHSVLPLFLVTTLGVSLPIVDVWHLLTGLSSFCSYAFFRFTNFQ